MFCKYCGKEVKDGSAFCPYCGKTLTKAGQTVQEPAAPVSPAVQQKPVKKKSGGKKTALWIILAAVVICACAVGFFVMKGTIKLPWMNHQETSAVSSASAEAVEETPKATAKASASASAAADDDEMGADEYLLGAAQTFRDHYQSYIAALNAQDASLIQYCNDAQKEHETAKLADNKDDSFALVEIDVDVDTFTYTKQTDDSYQVSFKAKVQNSSTPRSGGTASQNSFVEKVEETYVPSTKTWTVTSALAIDDKDIGKNQYVVK